jgi:hypothetical protein
MTTGPLAIAALIAWLITVSIGGYMLRTWIARGGLRRQRATGVGVPPPVVFGHAGAALTGLATWLGYLVSGWDPLAWLGVGLVATAITLGICTVTLWTPYPVLPGPEAVMTVGPGGAVQAAAAERADAITVTDEMIASLLAEPFAVRRRRRLQLLPLVPVIHGFAALATFLLTMLAALSGR